MGKPVLFVAGNHEYYTRTPMRENEEEFSSWLTRHLPQVYFLRDEGVTIDGVNFLGGTMWTDFKFGDAEAMRHAALAMNDFRYIHDNGMFTPEASTKRHQLFSGALKKVVCAATPRGTCCHHSSRAVKPESQYLTSPLQPAFVAYDMNQLIDECSPDLWIYGHSHECDSQLVGGTRVLSNQLGYPDRLGGYECSEKFDAYGRSVEV